MPLKPIDAFPIPIDPLPVVVEAPRVENSVESFRRRATSERQHPGRWNQKPTRSMNCRYRNRRSPSQAPSPPWNLLDRIGHARLWTRTSLATVPLTPAPAVIG